jgi:hypothetical protein
VHPLRHPYSRAQATSCVRVGWRSLAAPGTHHPLSSVGVQDMAGSTAWPVCASLVFDYTRALDGPEHEPGAVSGRLVERRFCGDHDRISSERPAVRVTTHSRPGIKHQSSDLGGGCSHPRRCAIRFWLVDFRWASTEELKALERA